MNIDHLRVTLSPVKFSTGLVHGYPLRSFKVDVEVVVNRIDRIVSQRIVNEDDFYSVFELIFEEAKRDIKAYVNKLQQAKRETL